MNNRVSLFFTSSLKNRFLQVVRVKNAVSNESRSLFLCLHTAVNTTEREKSRFCFLYARKRITRLRFLEWCRNTITDSSEIYRAWTFTPEITFHWLSRVINPLSKFLSSLNACGAMILDARDPNLMVWTSPTIQSASTF